MQYLDWFKLPNDNDELEFRFRNSKLFYTNNAYPLDIFPKKQLERIDFAPITVFYGGNGSGKSTLLNLIAEKLKITRQTSYNRTNIFDEYVEICKYGLNAKLPTGSEIITSDGVFDLLLDTRAINDGNEKIREQVVEEYRETIKSQYRMKSLDDYDELKRNNDARRNGGRYISSRVPPDIAGHSNGESAYLFFTQRIKENALYLLDEPENSLSSKYQIALAEFIENSVRFYNCQFIISSHSPFILSLRGARIYDLDSRPAAVKKWSELENIKLYFELFNSRKDEF